MMKEGIALLLLLSTLFLTGQAIYNQNVVVEGVMLYPDYSKSNLYYYSPQKIQVKLDKNGFPSLKFVRQKYVQKNGDIDFVNQIFIELEKPLLNTKVGNKIKGSFTQKIRLKELPIRSLKLNIGLPNDNNNSNFNNLFSNGKNEKAVWNKKTCIINIEDYFSQLIWKQAKSDQLFLSFMFSYDADFVMTNEDQGVENQELTKTIISDAFVVELSKDNTEQHFIDIDANDIEMIASYAHLKFLCNDFENHLQKEIGIKTIIVNAIGLAGQNVEERITFSKQHPNGFKSLVFSKAVNTSEGFRYRTQSYSASGEKMVGEWKFSDEWNYPIDVSDSHINKNYRNRKVEFEVDFSDYSLDVDHVVIQVIKRVGDNSRTFEKIIDKTTSNLVEFNIVLEENSKIYYSYILKSKEETIFRGQKLEALDDYYFIKGRQ